VCFLNGILNANRLYMIENVHPKMVMITLRDLIETPLYKDLNVTIHYQWKSLFSLHMDLDGYT
jgi:hypothetical protein